MPGNVGGESDPKTPRCPLSFVLSVTFPKWTWPTLLLPEVVLAHFAFVALLTHLRQIVNPPIRFRKLSYLHTGENPLQTFETPFLNRFWVIF